MSSRRTSPTVLLSRTVTSDKAQKKPRHTSRTQPQVTSATYSSHVVDMIHSNFALVSAPSDVYSEVAPCWPPVTGAYYSGNDSAHIPALSVAPTDLSQPSCWESMTYDVNGSSSSSSSGPSRSNISPPLSEAEILPLEVFQATPVHYEMDQFSHYQDPWVVTGLPPTPPAEPMFDNFDLFTSGKPDTALFPLLPEPATECEFLGVSKLQFSRALPRSSQPRPIRSASERTPASSVSGSPPKDEPAERVKNNPRNDPRYEAKAGKDGHYHCPYADDGTCNHKPTKQKCIYAKNLDSHLKPYTCKYGAMDENCRSLRFSSNACLFRHEREMHGMHNHGINPYLCKFPGCERARRDNGFPRRWNQRDHMKRVHGWEEPDNDDGAERGYNDNARRRKGSGASNSVPMKRTYSSNSGYYQARQRNVSAPRYAVQQQRELQAHSIVIPGMIDNINYPQPMVTQSYIPGLYDY